MIPFEMTISLVNPIRGAAHEAIFGDSINNLSKTFLKMILRELSVSTRVVATLLVTNFNVITKASSWGYEIH